MKSYSQFGEDSWILKHLPLPARGTFCEVGAYDGVASSNTKAFEEEGWTGLCIEPDPDIARLCKSHRTCITISAAVGLTSGLVAAEYRPFLLHPTDQGQSRLSRPGEGGIMTRVMRLDFILNALNIRALTLLSIDTEGTELDVWDSLTPLGHRPEIVIMEFLTWGSPPRDKEIVARMTADGYKEAHRTEANLIFTRV